MIISRHDTLEFYAGDTWPMMFTCQNVDGSPIILDGSADITWKLDDKLKEVRVLTLNRTSGVVVANANAGICLITVTPDQSGLLTAGRYFDELSITKAGQFTLCEGMILVRHRLP